MTEDFILATLKGAWLTAQDSYEAHRDMHHGVNLYDCMACASLRNTEELAFDAFIDAVPPDAIQPKGQRG